jgi:hypothetical protein
MEKTYEYSLGQTVFLLGCVGSFIIVGRSFTEMISGNFEETYVVQNGEATKVVSVFLVNKRLLY